MPTKQELIDYIVENADKDWINSFIHDVIEYDWVSDLQIFSPEILERWAKELGQE